MSRAATRRIDVPVIQLPTLHAGQVDIFQRSHEPMALCCGRRWGKTAFFATIAIDVASKGERVGFFAPDYKVTTEFYAEVADALAPIKLRSSQQNGIYRTTTGGHVDIWTLDNDRAGRSRKYHKVLIDEAAFTKNKNMMEVWEKSIKPTLLDFGGIPIIASTPSGVNTDNFFLCLLV